MSDSRFISNSSPEWIESLYEHWQADPTSIDTEWQIFFSGFALAVEGVSSPENHYDESFALKVSGVQSLIYRYRSLGHLIACTDPLSPCQISHPLLELSEFGLEESDLALIFPTSRFGSGHESLSTILDSLRNTYCRSIGVEFMHIQDPLERQWLIEQMEVCRNKPEICEDDQLLLLEKLHEANYFETYLQRRFPGQKRFSLEGGETLIPALYLLASASPSVGIRDIVLGMAHRGRLNVLAHLFGKPYQNIFAEFTDTLEIGFVGDGDVKYHKGYSAECKFDDGSVHLTLTSNPSHLEAVNSVVEGKCRARQDRYGGDLLCVLPVLIHGDAAFAGQGSCMETLTLSGLDGYTTGGTLHIVLNNQIGFTTQPRDSRSTLYSTDAAKILSCPIFHVHGESPEAIRHTILLALQYRQKYMRDVVVEIICYRRHGHNEGDEPSFTQPIMYQKISVRSPVNQIYADYLLNNGVSQKCLDEIKNLVMKRLDEAFDTPPLPKSIGYNQLWDTISPDYNYQTIETSVEVEKMLLLARKLVEMPPGFFPHPKIATLVQKRFENVLKGGAIDWGTAETLAYATLLDEGVSIRLSGEDCRRGTFSHRHTVLHDIHDGRTVVPLSKLANAGASFQVWDSPLSEFGVLGFEYGYSLETPYALTIWEAQFGDFANGAQVIIDQFIASGETKWNRASGLTLLLPHGFEGQGGEHSSARIERFLQLCAKNNMQVVNPSTPAQLFHLLRRQIKQSFRKPLIVFTPKSLLRHPSCVSPCDSFHSEHFYPVIADSISSEAVSQVLFCSGKVYYDLLAERMKRNDCTTAIVRVEQLYPFQPELLRQAIASYSSNVRFVWVQEEPENMGAWRYLQPELLALLGEVYPVMRPADSCPAVGSHRLHEQQQVAIIEQAFQKKYIDNETVC